MCPFWDKMSQKEPSPMGQWDKKEVSIMELEMSSKNFKEILDSNEKVLVDFYADWCGPCKMMAPVVEELAEELNGVAKVGKVNVDNNQDLAMQFNVMSIPTLIIFKNGEVVKRFVGVTDKQDLINAIK